MNAQKTQDIYFHDDGTIPNSKLPVIVYYSITDVIDKSTWFEQNFAKNNWLNNWRDIILPYDHFHSNTHEILGISKGIVTLNIGGAKGKQLLLSAGDALLLPAGVGHYFVSSAGAYEVVGGYPDGGNWNLLQELGADKDSIYAEIDSLEIPQLDPIHGLDGPMHKYWKK